MSGWGGAFREAWDAGSDAGRQNVQVALESARAAAKAVGQAMEAGARKSEAAVSAVKDRAVRTAAATAEGAGNIMDFGARAAGDAASAVADRITAAATLPYRVAKRVFSPSKPPRPIQPCPASAEAKIERLQLRNKAIVSARRSVDPSKREAAERLARNNEAVELARLSDNAYAQYPGPEFTYPTAGEVPAPTGWSVVPKEELEARGVSVRDLEDARAVVYRTPEDWPGGAKTVVSFRGTADLEDGIVDHDQAMAVPTTQYKAAMRVGDSMSTAYGASVEVTGHSLGGGKAQAAGVAGGLKGVMFNAAGLNPETTGNLVPTADQFGQYRTTGDPLTGVQNSPATQTAIATVAGVVAMPLGAGMKAADWTQKALGMQGLSPEMVDYADRALKAFPRGMKNLIQRGDVMPPAIGSIHEVPALDQQGRAVSSIDLLGQHSISSVVNGIERQKEDDLATMAT